MSETQTLPVSLEGLIAEIKKINEKYDDEFYFSEIQEQLSGMKTTALRQKLLSLEKQGKVASRRIGSARVWKYTVPIGSDP